jgi:hypothetical protein
MAVLIEDARRAAVCVATLALGCVSTDDLFLEAPPPPASVPTAVTPSAPNDDAQSAVPPAGPEQLLGAGRDEPPPSQVQDADAGVVAADAAASAPPATEVATDPCALEDAIVCDTFEEMSADVFPEGAPWLPELAGCGSHTIDGAGPSTSGTNALRAGGGGYPECMLHAELSGEDDIYVRTRVFIEGTVDLLSEYLTLIEFGVFPAQDDPELRIGVRPELDSVCPGAPGLDVSGSGLAMGTATACTGFVLEAERWYCLEAHLVRAGVNSNLSVSIDGAPLAVRDFVGADPWAVPDLYVKLGRASYGASGSGSIWHDDVAIGRQPIPCQP